MIVANCGILRSEIDGQTSKVLLDLICRKKKILEKVGIHLPWSLVQFPDLRQSPGFGAS